MAVALRKRIEKRNFTDPRLKELLQKLRKGSKFWKAVAKRLSTPSNSRISVNISKINRLGYEKVVIPGKVLGAGNLSKKVEVVAYSFSEQAKNKVKKMGGNIKLIEEEFESNPEGKGLRVII